MSMEVHPLFSLHATFPPQFSILLSHLSTWSSPSYASYNLSTHIEAYTHFTSTSQSSLISTCPLLPFSNLLLLSTTLCLSEAASLPCRHYIQCPYIHHNSSSYGVNLSPTSPYFPAPRLQHHHLHQPVIHSHHLHPNITHPPNSFPLQWQQVHLKLQGD